MCGAKARFTHAVCIGGEWAEKAKGSRRARAEWSETIPSLVDRRQSIPPPSHSAAQESPLSTGSSQRAETRVYKCMCRHYKQATTESRQNSPSPLKSELAPPKGVGYSEHKARKQQAYKAPSAGGRK